MKLWPLWCSLGRSLCPKEAPDEEEDAQVRGGRVYYSGVGLELRAPGSLWPAHSLTIFCYCSVAESEIASQASTN